MRVPAKLIRHFLLILMFLPCTNAGAQSQYEIGEVLIERRSLSEGREIMNNSVSGKVVITRRDLVSFGYSTAGDVVRNLPMVYIDSDPGVNRNISFGGLDREYQAVLINGRKPAGGEDSRDLKLDRIPVWMIERIEVDYNSPAYETSDGVAGTINIILKEDVKNEGLYLHISPEHHTTSSPGIKAEAGMERNIGKTELNAGISVSDYSREISTSLSDSSTGIEGGSDETITTRIISSNVGTTISTGKNSSLILKAFFSWFDEDEYESADVKRRKDGTLNIRNTVTNNDKLSYLHTWDAGWKLNKGRSSLKVDAGFANNFEKRHKDQVSEKTDMTEEAREYEDQDNYSLTLDIDYRLKELKLGRLPAEMLYRTGFSANMRNNKRINASRPQGYLLWDMSDESYNLNENIGYFSFALRTDLRPWLTLLPSLRYEHSNTDFSTVSDEGDIFYNCLSPSLNAKVRLFPANDLTIGIGQHIARPAFMSMVPIEKVKIKKDVIEVGNPDLVPSRSWGINLGDRWYYQKESYISLNLYYKWVWDMINLSYTGIDPATGYNVYTFINIDRARLYGFFIESELSLASVADGLSLNVNYSFLGSSVRNLFSGDIQKIDDQPDHLFNVKIDYLNTLKKVNISLGCHYNSRKIIFPVISPEGLPIDGINKNGYLQAEGKIKYYFSKWGSLYFTGENILNRPSVTTQGPVTETFYPGSIYRLGVNIMLQR